MKDKFCQQVQQPQTIWESFGAMLIESRKQKQITVDELAITCGVGRQTIYRWETGRNRPSPPKVRDLALALEIQADAILATLY